MKSNNIEFFDTLFSRQSDPYGRELYKIEKNKIIIEKWREKFAKRLHDQTGEWSAGGYCWHIFRLGYAPALEGDEAIERYHKLKTTRGFVFTHPGSKHPLACLAPQLPSFVAIEYALSLFRELADVYVVDRDFAWTFVVTHEKSYGIGPFFCEALS